jgi:hypothetical protein
MEWGVGRMELGVGSVGLRVESLEEILTNGVRWDERV